MARRVLQLLVGLLLYGAGCALTVEAGLGVDPWTVFAQGLSIHTGIGIGWVTNIVGFLVLLLWIPLRQKPGVGHDREHPARRAPACRSSCGSSRPSAGSPLRSRVLLGGILLVALASGLYIGARFGPGPRDGLMTGHARAPRLADLGVPRARRDHRCSLVGWLLGGTVGIGTVLVRGAHRTARARRAAAARHAPRTDAATPVERRRRGATPIGCRDQCSRNSGQSLPGVIRECSAFFAISIEG